MHQVAGDCTIPDPAIVSTVECTEHIWLLQSDALS